MTASLLALATQAAATPVPVINGSFEDPAQAEGGFTTDVVTGWSVSGGGVFNPTTSQISNVPDGLQVGYLNTSGSMSQALAAVVLADSTYTLQVDAVRRLDCCGSTTFTIALMGGSDVLASASQDFSLLTPDVPVTLSAIFDSSTLSSAVGSALSIVFNSTGIQADFDNVRLRHDANNESSGVPEPATALLLGAGLAAVGAAVRRRLR